MDEGLGGSGGTFSSVDDLDGGELGAAGRDDSGTRSDSGGGTGGGELSDSGGAGGGATEVEPPATCDDAVQNQDETGVDCGGVSCAPCPCAPDAPQLLGNPNAVGNSVWSPSLSDDALAPFIGVCVGGTSEQIGVTTRPDRGDSFDFAISLPGAVNTGAAPDCTNSAGCLSVRLPAGSSRVCVERVRERAAAVSAAVSALALTGRWWVGRFGVAGWPARAFAVGLMSCSAGTDASVEAGSSAVALPTSACDLGPDRASPSTVLEVVDRVNELPKPVSLPCFIESLARPLEVYATESIVSAQPAVGRRSPRTFLFVDPLIMSIAFDGAGSRLLEMGEVRPGGRRALKAEIEFPVTADLSRAAPFERIAFVEGLTTCGGCHDEEEPAGDVTFADAFDSRALRPLPRERVSLESLELELRSCDVAAEPERCALLEAVLGRGPIVDRDFPDTMATFY